MAIQTRTPKNILTRMNEIRFEYRQSLDDDNIGHRDWAKKQVKNEFKLVMGWNINSQNHRDHRYRWHSNYISFGDVIGMKTRSIVLDKTFKKAIKDDDVYSLLELLNNRDYRVFRDRSDWREIIENVMGDEIRQCDDCNSLEHQDDMRYAYDGDRAICESCCDRNYHWSDYRDTYIHDDDEDEDDNGLIGEYHSSSERLEHIPSLHDKHKNPIYLGLELEMETNGSDRYTKAEQLLNAIGRYNDGKNSHQYCLLENDGSLDDGFEMVTGWTGLDVHEQQLKFFENPFTGMRSHDTRTCGLHIHICKTGMSMSHASKLILFINESGNQKLIRSIARRENPDYAKIKNKKADYRWLRDAKESSTNTKYQLMQLNADRYEALNFKNSNTVEFRMFKGTLKYSTIMACLEFTYASWHFARDTGLQNLTTNDFLAYISKPSQLKTTKFLRAYLQEKGFSIPTPVKKNPRIESTIATTAEV